MSPERAGSPQEEKVMTPKMSVPGSPVAGTPPREAQSAFSLLLAVASQSNKSPDDDLTSLTWLQDKDLLKGMNLANPSPSNSVQSTPNKWTANLLTDQSPTSDYVDDSSVSAADSSSSSMNSPIPQPPQTVKLQQRLRHPHTIPYDPMVHVTNKPPYSFSCLIFMAIEDSQQKALPVKEIYSWIMDHFPYFKTAPTGWKNSVRHNLSLNKCFQKVEKAPNLGKGSLWTVDEQFRPNLLQALTRSPFHPCSTLDPSDFFNKTKPTEKSTNNTRLPNPELFPYLSSEMSRLVKTEISDSDSLDAVDAATVMLSLRNGPRYRMKRNMVITTSPSQDHTYSAAENQNGSHDEAFESDDDRLPSIRRKIDFEDEEDRKIKEGAETLLNLAGIPIIKRNQQPEHQPNKRTRVFKEELPEETAKPAQFRPRMLRKKQASKKYTNNNNNNSIAQLDADWMKQKIKIEVEEPR